MKRHIFNVLSGIIVLTITFVALSISAIGEGSSPNYAWLYMLGIWLVGFALQFKKTTRTLGIIIVSLSLVVSIGPIVFDIIVHQL